MLKLDDVFINVRNNVLIFVNNLLYGNGNFLLLKLSIFRTPKLSSHTTRSAKKEQEKHDSFTPKISKIHVHSSSTKSSLQTIDFGVEMYIRPRVGGVFRLPGRSASRLVALR